MDKETEVLRKSRLEELESLLQSESLSDQQRRILQAQVAFLSEPASEPISPGGQRLWFVELWFEKRELFKEFMGEAFFIGVMLAILEIVHRLILRTSLEPQQISLLSKTHFYMTFGSLVILSLGFIITLLKSLRGKKK